MNFDDPIVPIQHSNQSEVESVDLDNKKNPFQIVLFILGILFFMILGALIYSLYLSQNTENKSQTADVIISPVVTVHPQVAQKVNSVPLGTSKLSFAIDGEEVLMKRDVSINNLKAKDYGGTSGTSIYSGAIREYSQGGYSDSGLKEKNNIDLTKYNWIDLVEEEISDFEGSEKILVMDSLLDFKEIPGTNSFLFVVNWDRVAAQNLREAFHYKNESVLYFYDMNKTENKLSKIQTFGQNSINDPQYVLIAKFSQDNRYVLLDLLRCVQCDTNKPDFLLLDLKTLETKGIGRVKDFLWRQNGEYEYKDYIVIKCEEPSSYEGQGGECTQDLNTLPLRIGQF